MVYALSDTIWQTIDTKITVGVKNFLGVIDRNFLIKTGQSKKLWVDLTVSRISA